MSKFDDGNALIRLKKWKFLMGIKAETIVPTEIYPEIFNLSIMYQKGSGRTYMLLFMILFLIS
ncbi:hypothetical protein L950_0232000 [Sphingobacterium sp. IITKGP-BTPF85]|nr:hypothetical protein L950_0232000 [Sphingobacterium sp. IITKGP-BTPF85]